MAQEGRCWVCGKDRELGDPLMFVDNQIVGAEDHDTYDVCTQCAPIIEEYYQEWRRDLQQTLRYRLKRGENTKKSLGMRVFDKIRSLRGH